MELVNDLCTPSAEARRMARPPAAGALAGRRRALPRAIAVLREAIDAPHRDAVPRSRPIRPKSCGRLLGHPEGSAKAVWPSFDPEVAKADEVVVPCRLTARCARG